VSRHAVFDNEGWLAAILPRSLYCPPCQQKYTKSDGDRWKQDLRQKAFFAIRVGQAIAKGITNQQEHEYRQTYQGRDKAAPFSFGGWATPVSSIIHLHRLASLSMTDMGR
jgi:hypothetical protein